MNISNGQVTSMESLLTFERVQKTNDEKFTYLVDLFKSKHCAFPNDKVYFRAFKFSKKFEVWAYSTDSAKMVLINTYNICQLAGDLGPKREEGDQQIPEGFYYITDINPASKYFLSLGINYPNESDKVWGTQGKLGNDIYIHGGCETIGCLPMTDAMIKEIFLIAAYASAAGQTQIPVHIFPTRLTTKNFIKLKDDYFKGNTKFIAFWSQLKQGYDYFERTKIVPTFDIIEGNYILRK
jgi:murein L,D-transpeptidase YafK